MVWGLKTWRLSHALSESGYARFGSDSRLPGGEGLLQSRLVTVVAVMLSTFFLVTIRQILRGIPFVCLLRQADVVNAVNARLRYFLEL